MNKGMDRRRGIDPLFYRRLCRWRRYVRRMCRISESMRKRHAFSSMGPIRALCVKERENKRASLQSTPG